MWNSNLHDHLTHTQKIKGQPKISCSILGNPTGRLCGGGLLGPTETLVDPMVILDLKSVILSTFFGT